jgi:hypothetical protein
MKVSGQLQGPAALPQRKNQYPFDRRLDGPQSRFEPGGEEKYIFFLKKISVSEILYIQRTVYWFEKSRIIGRSFDVSEEHRDSILRVDVTNPGGCVSQVYTGKQRV